MKTVSALTLLTLTVTPAAAFQTFPLATERASGVVRFAYVPDGFTKESYAKFKADEAKKKQKKKNLGELGPKGFQSRSFQSFQEALERGEAKHLMPVTNAKKRIAAGELREEDIPVSSGRVDSFSYDEITNASLLFTVLQILINQYHCLFKWVAVYAKGW